MSGTNSWCFSISLLLLHCSLLQYMVLLRIPLFSLVPGPIHHRDLSILSPKYLPFPSTSLYIHCPVTFLAQITITAHLDYCNILLNVLRTLSSTHSPTELCFQNLRLSMSFLCLKPFNDLSIVFGIMTKSLTESNKLAWSGPCSYLLPYPSTLLLLLDDKFHEDLGHACLFTLYPQHFVSVGVIEQKEFVHRVVAEPNTDITVGKDGLLGSCKSNCGLTG